MIGTDNHSATHRIAQYVALFSHNVVILRSVTTQPHYVFCAPIRISDICAPL
jgi:hypothetical protein